MDVLYKDETGRLGHTFNLMSEELARTQEQVKGYALSAAVAKIKEEKIRHVFQKYVPKTVLESFFANPEAALVGENRILAVLFSDIRGFTEHLGKNARRRDGGVAEQLLRAHGGHRHAPGPRGAGGQVHR